MAFGMNKVLLIGRLGADAEVRHLQSGTKVANMSLATDESYYDKNRGERVQKAEWHRVITFQDGLVDILERKAVKGRLVQVEGKLQTRKWQDQDGKDRYATEILVVPNGRIQFLDKDEDFNVSRQPAPVQNEPMPSNFDDEIPF